MVTPLEISGQISNVENEEENRLLLFECQRDYVGFVVTAKSWNAKQSLRFERIQAHEIFCFVTLNFNRDLNSNLLPERSNIQARPGHFLM